MKLIQDCLVPVAKPVWWVEPERTNIFHVLACTTYSAVARFGAEVRDWLTPRAANHSGGHGRRTTGAEPTRAADTSLAETPTQRSRVAANAHTASMAPARVPIPLVARSKPAQPVSTQDCADDNCVHQRELSRVRRDLHDKVGSSLAGMTMQLEVVQRLLCSDTDRAVRMLDELHSTTSHLLTTVREMSARRRRRPERRGGDGGMLPAGPQGCDNMAEALRYMTGRMQRATRDRLEITLDLGEDAESVRGEVGRAAFWIVNEALTNVLRHSHARRCAVALWTSEDELLLQVEDDGIGGIDAAGGSGLGNMADRAAEQGGWCTVRNGNASGVVVLASLPLRGKDRDAAQRSAPSGSRGR